MRKNILEFPINRGAVKFASAEVYLFNSSIAFGLTEVTTRIFLQITGYQQLGNSVLHIAHVLWSGILLFTASLRTLILANRWAFTTSAILNGIGIDLFIDGVSKFILQKNDNFYAPAAPYIYPSFY